MLEAKNIQWIGDADTGRLRLLDQTRLPGEVTYLECGAVADVVGAIKRLSVRGAPAIGIAAAYGCVIGAQPGGDESFTDAIDDLARSRPTAVNLFWALERMKKVQPCTAEHLLSEARAIHDEDADMCRRIGEHGAALIERCVRGQRPGVLTHCNAGALATGGIGTATAPMYLAHERGVRFKVFADETRPLLQGSRLTAFELAAAGVDVTVICDSAAATVMRGGEIGMVITGADRIAANGDAANKIGTYNLAVQARHHDIPFYVAAPSSTFDLNCPTGDAIPIEQRDQKEVLDARPIDAKYRAYNPAFDVTSNDLITAIITEQGVVEPVDADQVHRVVGRGGGY